MRPLFACALTLALVTPARLAAAQDEPDSVGGFPYRAFAVNERIANWILAYDRVAWITSDSVMAAPPALRDGLGGEWFCLEQADTWHAVYGRYSADSQRYRIVFHYQGGATSPFVSSKAPLDTLELVAFARALSEARAAFPDTLTATNIRFNQYVRRLPDRSIEVWFLPAQQSNGLIVWGAELRYIYASDGGARLASTVTGSALRGLYPDTTRTVDINERTRDIPSVGAIFVLLAYKHDFQKIYVWTSRFLTTLVRGDDGQYVWINAVRDSTARKPPN